MPAPVFEWPTKRRFVLNSGIACRSSGLCARNIVGFRTRSIGYYPFLYLYNIKGTLSDNSKEFLFIFVQKHCSILAEKYEYSRGTPAIIYPVRNACGFCFVRRSFATGGKEGWEGRKKTVQSTETFVCRISTFNQSKTRREIFISQCRPGVGVLFKFARLCFFFFFFLFLVNIVLVLYMYSVICQLYIYNDFIVCATFSARLHWICAKQFTDNRVPVQADPNERAYGT